MNQNWHGTLIRHMLLLITGCLLVGLVSGYYGWSLAIGIALYLGWTLKQLLRLHEWLRQHKPDEAPPDGYGLWGEVMATWNGGTALPRPCWASRRPRTAASQ
jgi:two-component system phosphate regulon sensor histidine kinase PhoR